MKARFLTTLLAISLCASAQRSMGQMQMRDGGVSEVLQSIYIPPLLNAPFTAVVHTEWARPIPGGGTYTAVNQRRVARDSRGRIYEERWLLVPKGGNVESQMNVIQIADPNTHELYNCFTLVKPHRCNLLKFAEPPLKAFKPALRPTGPLPNSIGFTTQEDLGTRTVAGVDTVGTRETVTINTGVWGNDRPLVTVREFWQAPNIGVNLLSIVDGPRTGKQTFTLSDVSFSEPDPQLFQIPEGFQVVDRRHKQVEADE